MFSTNDYLNLLEKEIDGVGDEFMTGPINAGAMSVILSLNPGLTYDKLKRLPNTVAWSLFNKLLTEKAYKEDVIEAAVKYVADYDTKRLGEGVKDILSGKEFLVYITSGGIEFGIGQLTGKMDISKVLTGLPEEEVKHIHKSANFKQLLSCIKKIDGEITPVLGIYDKLKSLSYLDYMLLSEIQIRLQDKLFTMDWKEMLKN